MTRELLFITTFESEFQATTGWKSLDTNPGSAPVSSLAPSDMPGFFIVPGETRYLTYDGTGFPTSGTQNFTLRIFFSHSQLALGAWRSTRSDYVGIIETFFSGAYTPPIVSTGDQAR